MKNSIAGTGVALITPFNDDYSVDYQSLKNIINFNIENGVNFLVALGTTSEAPTLTEIERKLVVKTIVETSADRVPVVLGLGGNSTQLVVDQIYNQDFTGISAILSVVPYYNKPQQAGIFAHFDAIASACPVSVILYNVPGRTSVNMHADTCLKLANKHKNIISIKEASGDLIQIMNIIQKKPSHFEVLSGDDALTLPMIACGSDGVISVIANALPSDFSRMVHAAMNDEMEEARDLHYKILRMTELIFADGNPSGVKALMADMDLCREVVRLPLVTVNEIVRKKISDEWNRIKD